MIMKQEFFRKYREAKGINSVEDIEIEDIKFDLAIPFFYNLFQAKYE